MATREPSPTRRAHVASRDPRAPHEKVFVEDLGGPEMVVTVPRRERIASSIQAVKRTRSTKANGSVALPPLSALIEKDGGWFVSTCPELGVSSQGRTRPEAYRMLREAVELWLESATSVEIRRQLRRGARVQELAIAPAVHA